MNKISADWLSMALKDIDESFSKLPIECNKNKYEEYDPCYERDGKCSL